MFFVLSLRKRVQLQPPSLGAGLRGRVTEKLSAEVEGRCEGKKGFVVLVVSVEAVSAGVVGDGTGLVSFDVDYSAIVLRPFRGEVLDMIVSSVESVGVLGSAGPVEIYVSRHLVPSDYVYEPAADPPAYVAAESHQRIAVGTVLRVRVVGVKFGADSITCVCTIAEDYLGPVGAH